jgi:hypothetical protein
MNSGIVKGDKIEMLAKGYHVLGYGPDGHREDQGYNM